MPVGPYVNYIPPSTTILGKSRSKFADSCSRSYLGLRGRLRGRWKKGYIVCPLEAFVGAPMTFSNRSAAKQINRRITVTEDVHPVPGTSPWLLLIDRAHYANRSLSGLTWAATGHSTGDDAGPSDKETPLVQKSRSLPTPSSPTTTTSSIWKSLRSKDTPTCKS